jgi:LPS O-antigen subunit length determinant protein (WzzB/FepE family)
MKDQISQIIETLDGKIQRAKHRKAQEIADDPTFMVMKGMYLKSPLISNLEHNERLKSLASNRKDLKREIEHIQSLLDDTFNINK